MEQRMFLRPHWKLPNFYDLYDELPPSPTIHESDVCTVRRYRRRAKEKKDDDFEEVREEEEGEEDIVILKSPKHVITDPRFVDSYIALCSALCGYRHPCVLRLLDVVPPPTQDRWSSSLVLESCDGVNLEAYARDNVNQLAANEGALADLLIAQIVGGVAHLASDGFRHRNLRPDNILVISLNSAVGADDELGGDQSDPNEEGQEMKPDIVCPVLCKIHPIGFSYANYCRKVPMLERKTLKFADPDRRSWRLEYLAPEAIKDTAATAPIDRWSVGLIIYFILFQQHPLDDPNNLKEILPESSSLLLGDAVSAIPQIIANRFAKAERANSWQARYKDVVCGLVKVSHTERWTFAQVWKSCRWLITALNRFPRLRESILPVPTFPKKYRCIRAHFSSEGNTSHIHLFQQLLTKNSSNIDSAAGAALTDGEDVIVKVPKAPEGEYKRHHLREGKIHRAVRHPCIVRLFDIVEDEVQVPAESGLTIGSIDIKRNSLVLEYCNGGNLASFLMRGCPIDDKAVDHCIAQIVAGVTHIASRGLVHRDLKPDNIFLSTSSSERNNSNDIQRVKVGDFGFSVFADKERHLRVFASEEALAPQTSRNTGRTGSRPYTSPEVLLDEPYSFPADMWSLGLVIFFIIFRYHPLGSLQLTVENIKWIPNAIRQRFSGIKAARSLTEREQKYEELICGLVEVDQENRWTVSDVWNNCDWLLRALEGDDDTSILHRVQLDRRVLATRPIFSKTNPRVPEINYPQSLVRNADLVDQYPIKQNVSIVQAGLCVTAVRRQIGDKTKVLRLLDAVKWGNLVVQHPYIAEVLDIQASSIALQQHAKHTLIPSSVVLWDPDQQERNAAAGPFYAQVFVEYYRGECLEAFLNNHISQFNSCCEQAQTRGTVDKREQDSINVHHGELFDKLKEIAAGLFSAILHLHSRGQCHGSISVKNILVSSALRNRAKIRLNEKYLYSSGSDTCRDDMKAFARVLTHLKTSAERLSLQNDAVCAWCEDVAHLVERIEQDEDYTIGALWEDNICEKKPQQQKSWLAALITAKTRFYTLVAGDYSSWKERSIKNEEMSRLAGGEQFLAAARACCFLAQKQLRSSTDLDFYHGVNLLTFAKDLLSLMLKRAARRDDEGHLDCDTAATAALFAAIRQIAEQQFAIHGNLIACKQQESAVVSASGGLTLLLIYVQRMMREFFLRRSTFPTGTITAQDQERMVRTWRKLADLLRVCHVYAGHGGSVRKSIAEMLQLC